MNRKPYLLSILLLLTVSLLSAKKPKQTPVGGLAPSWKKKSKGHSPGDHGKLEATAKKEKKESKIDAVGAGRYQTSGVDRSL